MEFPKKLQQQLDHRKTENTFRELGKASHLIDFSSNDYLGFSKSETIFDAAYANVIQNNHKQNGATGSRLLSGNHSLNHDVETLLANSHKSEAALLFNSGYNANLGFFSCVPQRGDVILYDEYIHASIRDGISISHAKGYKFKHNDLKALEKLMLRFSKGVLELHQNIYVVTESVFSMDGDSPKLKALTQLCKKNKALLIIDEAHALGVFGKQGEGRVQDLNLQNNVFARIITFGKALGCHGAAILSSKQLKTYLVNFSRSFIYTTALPPHSLATIQAAYHAIHHTKNRKILHCNINYFKSEIIKNKLTNYFIKSHSAIHSCIIPENSKVKSVAKALESDGFDVKAIVSPTVPKGEERLRFCLHSYNAKADIKQVLKKLADYIKTTTQNNTFKNLVSSE